MKHYAKLAAAMYAAAVLASCLSPYTGDDKTGLPGGGNFEEVSELFWPEGSGTAKVVRFFTNDPKYRTPTGYTLWAYCSEPETFHERTVSVRKTYGNRNAGYGVILCSNRQQVEGEWKTVFLTVMINNNGEYAVGKVIGTAYSSLEIKNWNNSTGLNGNTTGTWDKIKITRDTTTSNRVVYNLCFNDVNEGLSFVDAEYPVCEGYNSGRNGYLVVIAPDDLNKSSVEVFFQEN